MMQHYRAFELQKTETRWADYQAVGNEYFSEIKAAQKPYDETNFHY